MLDMWEAERAFIRWNIFETPHRHWLKTLGPNWVVMRRRYWKYTSRNWGQLGYCLVLQAIGLSASGCYGRERRTVIALIVLMGAKKWVEYGALQINGTGLLVFRKDISVFDSMTLAGPITQSSNNISRGGRPFSFWWGAYFHLR